MFCSIKPQCFLLFQEPRRQSAFHTCGFSLALRVHAFELYLQQSPCFLWLLDNGTLQLPDKPDCLVKSGAWLAKTLKASPGRSSPCCVTQPEDRRMQGAASEVLRNPSSWYQRDSGVSQKKHCASQGSFYLFKIEDISAGLLNQLVINTKAHTFYYVLSPFCRHILIVVVVEINKLVIITITCKLKYLKQFLVVTWLGFSTSSIVAIIFC